MKSKKLLAVISSPSGGGKTTICRGVLRRHKEYAFSISATTRKLRRGEKHGKDYYFITERQFKQRVRKGQLAEWAKVHSHYYGTLKRFVNLAQKGKKTVLFDVDVQGGTALKRRYPEAVLIFLLPPSISELRRRLRRRGANKPDEVKRRIKVALKEIGFVSKYDYVVVNRSINQSIRAVEEIINSELRRSNRFDLKRWIERMKL